MANNIVLSSTGKLELDLTVNNRIFLYYTTIPINWSCDEFDCAMGIFTILVNDVPVVNTDASGSGSFNIIYGDKVTTTMNCGNCDQAMLTINGAKYYSAVGASSSVTRDEYPISEMTINGSSYKLLTVNIGCSSYSCVATIDLVINGGSPHRYTNYGGYYTVHSGDRIEAHLSGGTCDDFSIWVDNVDTGLSDYLNASITQNVIIQGKGTDPLQINFGSTDTNCTSTIGLYVNDIFIAEYNGTYGGTYWANSGDKVEAYLTGGTCYESSIWINNVDTYSNHYKSSQLIATSIAIQGIGKSLYPTVTTNTVESILYTTASGGGNVTSKGSTSVTSRGICWSTSSNPTISNTHTHDGTGSGTFTSSMTGLTVNTLYYVRAYATNSIGTSYGDQETFTTLAATTTTTTTTQAPTTTTTTTCNIGPIKYPSYSIECIGNTTIQIVNQSTAEDAIDLYRNCTSNMNIYVEEFRNNSNEIIGSQYYEKDNPCNKVTVTGWYVINYSYNINNSIIMHCTNGIIDNLINY